MTESLAELHSSQFKRRHALLFTFYFSTGITNAVLLIMFEVQTGWYWWNIVCCVSLLGSLLLIVAAFLSLDSPKTAAYVGVLATILAWIPLGPFVFALGQEFIGHLLDRHFTTIVRLQKASLQITQNSLDGREGSSMGIPIYVLIPIILLASATVYSIWTSLRHRAE